MTEEIIIDGVNVAGCRHLKNDGIKKPICRSGGCIGVYNSCLCEDNIDCDYKQLKRLEQENKELKKQLSSTKCYLCGEGFLTPIGAELYEQNNNYRSALEEIRNYCDRIEQGSVIGTQDCLINSIKNITNEVLE